MSFIAISVLLGCVLVLLLIGAGAGRHRRRGMALVAGATVAAALVFVAIRSEHRRSEVRERSRESRRSAAAARAVAGRHEVAANVEAEAAEVRAFRDELRAWGEELKRETTRETLAQAGVHMESPDAEGAPIAPDFPAPPDAPAPPNHSVAQVEPDVRFERGRLTVSVNMPKLQRAPEATQPGRRSDRRSGRDVLVEHARRGIHAGLRGYLNALAQRIESASDAEIERARRALRELPPAEREQLANRLAQRSELIRRATTSEGVEQYSFQIDPEWLAELSESRVDDDRTGVRFLAVGVVFVAWRVLKRLARRNVELA